MLETDSKPRITSYGGDLENGRMTIEGISEKDRERVMACLQAGAYWIRVKDGELEVVPSWEKLPDPTQDEEMLPFWRKATKIETAQLQLVEIETVGEYDSPSISIQHLCGYDYSPESYRMQAEKLESYGFNCMRSRRGPDGKYWEVWFLYSLCGAKGDLKDKIIRHKGKNDLKIATSFLAQHVSFGTLDVSTQRLAMGID